MNFKSNKLRDAVIVALVASAATGGTAYAQETTGTTTDQPGTDQRGDQRGFGAAADREQDARR